MAVEDTIKTLVEELKKLIATGNLIGEPMEFEDKIIIPITKIGLGFGTGRGEGKGVGGKERMEGEGFGAGAGAGAGVGPAALITIFKGIAGPEGIKVLSLEAPSPVAKAIGEAVSKCAEIMGKWKEGERKSE